MKERPIIFNSEMVLAILEGRKTQTRRIAKGGNKRSFLGLLKRPIRSMMEPEVLRALFSVEGPDCSEEITSPYGMIGDRLWVRETWAGDDLCGFVYRADHPNADIRAGDLNDGDQQIRQWRPSIHMPRWAFANYFCKINSKRKFDYSPWDINPFVWVISFKRID